MSPLSTRRAFSLILSLVFLFPICSCGSTGSTEITVTAKPYTKESVSGTTTAAPLAQYASPFGPMALYEGTYPFAIQYPADWSDGVGKDGRCGRTQVCFVNRDRVLIIDEGDLGDVGGTGMSLEKYMDIILPDFGTDIPGFELLAREQIETMRGDMAEVLTFTFSDGGVKAKMLWFAYDGKVITVAYHGYEPEFEEQEPLIEYSFKSLRVTEGE